MSTPRILIHHLNYTIPGEKQLFKELSLAFGPQKFGLVGRNGIGKSTLLKLIVDELAPDSGSIEKRGTIAYCPQQPIFKSEETVADVLEVREKLAALERIKQGSMDENDFSTLNEDWTLVERIHQQLALFGLSQLNLEHVINTLSGGERTRLLLAKSFFANPDFIILDEPTNNLDLNARHLLYDAIKQWQGGLVVVSHDRTLLNLMDQIVELSTLGVNLYGGNYDNYVEQKTIETTAAEHELHTRKEQRDEAKRIIQIRKERHEQNEAHGRRGKKAQIIAKGSYDKIAFKSAQGRSENTNRRIRRQADRKLETIELQVQAAREKVEISETIDINIPKTKVPAGKVIIKVENLFFSYSTASKPIVNNTSFMLVGPERVALIGNNGSGKTTLIKLLLGELQASSGEIYIGTPRISYLDQTLALLNPELSVLENFLLINPEINETNARFSLASFLFRNTAALKLVKNLSGGEKLRAMLACTLMSQNPPQLLILDEPTNHLDLASIASIESALNHYQGAMIVISHDQNFLENIGIERVISMPQKT